VLSARARRWVRGLGVSLATLCALLAAGEAALRFSRQRERHFAATVNKTIAAWVELTRAGVFEEIADPVRRYALRPGADVVVQGCRFRVTRHRTRGADFPAAKPPGEKRLLCLGDSFAFGLWCDEDETVVGHLARLANAREAELGTGTTWRAVNLGVPGYHTGQQLRALEQDGLALQPDLVVVYFNTNDIEQEGFFFDERLGALRRDFMPLSVGLRRALWSSHLYGWLAALERRLLEAGPVPAHLNPRSPYAHVRADNQRATRAALERIRDLCREQGVPLFVVDQPLLTWQGEIRDPDWALLPLVAWAERTRAELGIPGVSLLGLFRGYSDGVDRLAEGAPLDLLLDALVADERIQAGVAWARARAQAAGRDWETLGAAERMALFAGCPLEIPAQPDFHLNGEGYGHVARVAHAALRSEGLMP
jgi:lysophospholipase L1-like esterase